MSQPIIEVRNLSKRYQLGAIGATSLREETSRLWSRLRGHPHPDTKEFWALREVSFDIQPGEVVGVIGRNGAGKSTLLKILSRITEPTSGTAKLRGRVASLLEVGTGFHPELTGRENVFLNGAILGMTRAEVRRKFDEIVAFAEVEKFIDTPVKRYSSGMYVRLAFAVAAHLEPEILIIDEVLAVGDAAFQKKCLGKMREVSADHGRTIFFVSHNASAIRSLCSHALLLELGRVTQFGPSPSVLETYFLAQAPAAAEAYWPDSRTAPGNKNVRLHRVRLLLPDPVRATPDTHTPFTIEIAYWNRVAGCEQNVSLVLHTTTGICVLNTYSASCPMPEGLITATCRIPGDFLNDETYQLEVYIVKDTSVVLYRHAEAFTFSVTDGQREGKWHGKHVGVVRPKLGWEIGPASS